MSFKPIMRSLGCQPYEIVWKQMQTFTTSRTSQTADEIWLVEHFPVYTLGLNGRREHLLNTKNIPVIQTDRGGQVTYHAHGQAVIYVLLDLTRLNLHAHELVELLEMAMLKTLAFYNITANAKTDARGVYVDDKKIGSIGLRVKKQGCYHGLSLNNDMDLTPFTFINPCGYQGLEMTQLKDFNVFVSTNELAKNVADNVIEGISIKKSLHEF